MKLVSAVLIAGLVAINGALGYAAWELSSTPLRAPGKIQTGQTGDIGLDLPTIGNDLQLIDVASFGQLATRPPFTSSRRPKAIAIAPKVQPATAPVAVMRPLNAELIGVVIETNRSKALIRIQSDQRLRILENGDRIDGWQLELIEETRVVFKQDAEQIELLLRPKP